MARVYKKRNSHANRGKDLEMYIDQAIERYRILKVAAIDRNETPIGINTVDPKTKKITDAFFKEKATVDYSGPSRGVFVAFDAKETEDKLKFPLKNLHKHQYERLKEYTEQGGVTFLLVHFKNHHETYILKHYDLAIWWEEGAKNIPYEFFKTKCIKCGPGRNVPLDFLAALQI